MCNDGMGMGHADTSPGHTGSTSTASHPEWNLGWALCTFIFWSAPNCFSKMLLLLCLCMLQTVVCQLWHRTSRNKAGLSPFPLVTLCSSLHLGKRLEKTLFAFSHVFPKAMCWPCFRMEHKLPLHSPSGIASMLSDSKMYLLHLHGGSTWHLGLLPRSMVVQDRSLVYSHVPRALLLFSPSLGQPAGDFVTLQGLT